MIVLLCNYELFDIVQDVSHTFLFRFHVEFVVRIRSDFDRNVFYDCQPVCFQSDTLDGVVGHQAHLGDSQMAQDLGTDAVIAFVCLMSEMQICIFSISPMPRPSWFR